LLANTFHGGLVELAVDPAMKTARYFQAFLRSRSKNVHRPRRQNYDDGPGDAGPGHRQEFRPPVVGSAGEAIQKALGICELWRRLLSVMEKAGIEMHMSRGVRNELEACDSAMDRLYKRLLKAP
jgi:hypothetical protein